MTMLPKYLRKALVLAAVAASAYGMGQAGLFKRSPLPTYELEAAIPPSAPERSALGLRGCVEPTASERSLVKAAVDVLAFSSERPSFLLTGVYQFLAHDYIRGFGKDARLVCQQPDQYERAAQLINDSDQLTKYRLTEYGLQLIVRLPHRGDALVKAVAASAFHKDPQGSEIWKNRDIRPLARASLASLGSATTPYAEQAFPLISIDDSMGTGAAQIAVAGSHPRALQLVEDLMTKQLASLPKDKVVPYQMRNRLYEMAYALSFGGPAAKQHVAPLRDLMAREVQSMAPPFGLIEMPPKHMCNLLSRIVEQPIAELGFDYCSDPKIPFESFL